MANEEKTKKERLQEPNPQQAKRLSENKARALRQHKGSQAPDQTKVFMIRNVVRRVQTRFCRAATPGRQRFKQYIGGRRLLRNQKMYLTQKQLEIVREDVRRGLKAGAFEMTDPEGWSYFVDVTGKICKRRGGEVKTEEGHTIEYIALSKKGPEVEPPSKEKVEIKLPSKEKVEPPLALKEESKPYEDDLTELPGIAAGRARKLNAAGIINFKQLEEMPPSDLVKILGSPMTEDQAAEICNAASEKVG